MVKRNVYFIRCSMIAFDQPINKNYIDIFENFIVTVEQLCQYTPPTLKISSSHIWSAC